MYRNLDSSDINDNKLSFFSKTRVIEDSLPSYLFALAVETLAIAARQNKDVEFFEDETKLFQYADDSTINDFVRCWGA